MHLSRKAALLLGLAALSVSGLAVVAPTRAAGTTITFDDLPAYLTQVPNGYKGLNWSNVYTLNPVATGFTTTRYGNGYIYGTISRPKIAYNGSGSIASFSSTTLFTLTSAYVTAAFNPENVTFAGSLLGTTLFTNTVAITNTAPTLVNFGFVGVDTVSFVGGSGQQGDQVVLDNIAINGGDVPAAPEPSSVVAFAFTALGLGGLMWRARKRRAA